MRLSLYKKEVFEQYKSNSQVARVLSENWFSSEMYCPCCLNTRIDTYPHNKKAIDFFCLNCSNEFQLKSSNKKFTKRVLDGEFNTMMNFINLDKVPNFFLMHYSNHDWYVKNLLIIPRFFITSSIIEKRNPLSEKARRHGWVGCNIILDNIPEDGKIIIIKDEKLVEKEVVSKKWKKMFFLNRQKPSIRGWTSDVLKCVEDLSENEFNLKDVYKFRNYLSELHPENKHVEAKIRQQLQILRDNQIIKFISRGNYQLINK